MRLVRDWRRAWRWYSSQALAVLALLPAVWVSLPPDLRSYVPESWMPWVVSAVALGGLIGRLIDQGSERE